jgi:hypothetical protein
MTAKSDLLAVMQQSRDALESAISPYRDNLTADLGDGWTAGEALAHIALWERVSAWKITGNPLPYGQDLVPQPWDLDTFNNALRGLMRAWTDEQILDEFAASHQALIQVVNDASEEDCVPRGRVWQTIDIDGAGHYHFHFPVTDAMATRWPEDVERG